MSVSTNETLPVSDFRPSAKKNESEGTSSASSSGQPRSSPEKPFTRTFFQRNDPQMARARVIYIKGYIGGTVLVIVTIFAVFSIYWGALWRVPCRPLETWVVDFDGGIVGLSVVQTLSAMSSNDIQWATIPASQFPEGIDQLAHEIVDEAAWAAVAINSGSSRALEASLLNPNASYDSSSVMTLLADEGRNENAYRNLIRPTAQNQLDATSTIFAAQFARQIANLSTLPQLMATSPQTVVKPISYTINNLVPFAQPVATAATFVGLIYVLILSFFIVVSDQLSPGKDFDVLILTLIQKMIGWGAREVSGLERTLTYRSLVTLRLISCFIDYFFVALFYSLLNLAFKLDVFRNGLALESVITILKPRFIPFFMILWVIANVSVCVYPIDTLPRLYRYGYAAPFYNISRSIRTIAFGTKNNLALNFGVLIVWVAISCVTLPVFQWYARRKQMAEVEEASKPREVQDTTGQLRKEMVINLSGNEESAYFPERREACRVASESTREQHGKKHTTIPQARFRCLQAGSTQSRGDRYNQIQCGSLYMSSTNQS
ncbi:uncharacterized protein LACBIDRAFT_307149 [Laccaria bicolor S238N-H82]|uniref:Predicted protein n=1 Tax=Laccaria bicolor (strain S238N-H82 / ATCC MYA-4686) TaxID=486041 RepID=B0DPH0_LACBS|nr:uncharacterized protein LACBIDRAFT_307149 [Laccaria bicolor S238N-H82]EDR03372.1 predicted protein [Laccaria bicolor S238N-H82]|eukprot:XP_001885828.1 predicted protein [Laccaria bicolor S238N-H82]